MDENYERHTSHVDWSEEEMRPSDFYFIKLDWTVPYEEGVATIWLNKYPKALKYPS